MREEPEELTEPEETTVREAGREAGQSGRASARRNVRGDVRADVRADVREAARHYLAGGWWVVPLRAEGKSPEFKAWTTLRIPPALVGTYFLPEHNIGVLTGEASTVDGRVLVDVDCDASEAVAAAALLLPSTARVHGRAGKPASHYWYLVEGAVETTKFAFESGTRSMLVELRAGGCQTMAPPSIHPSGERLRWERRGEPGRVSAGELLRAVAHVAAAALLARHWPRQGTRDETAMALTGMLMRGGWAARQADTFVTTVARAAGDAEWRTRGKGRQTARALAAGEPVTGATRLEELLGGSVRDSSAEHAKRIVYKAQTWLGLTADAGAHTRRWPTSHEGVHAQNVAIFGAVGHLRSVVLSEVQEVELHWLWSGRVPLGTITLLDGDPGLGKSMLLLDLIARVTTGRPMPEGTPGSAAETKADIAGGAVILSAEDDLGATIRPRLAAAGADLARIVAVQTVGERDPETGEARERAFTMPADIPLLREAIERVGAKVVMADPLMAYLDARVNSWRDQDVRTALAPLAQLAAETGVAVVIVRHLTKGSGGANAIYRGGGSIGIIGAARSGLMVAKDPDDPDHSRVLASTKSNLGPPMPSLRYRIHAPAPEAAPRIEWLGACDHSAASLLAASGVGEGVSPLDEACAFLRCELEGGARSATEVQHDARTLGISERTIRRARTQLGVLVERTGFGAGSRWVWKLAGAEATSGEMAGEGRVSQ